MGKKYKKVIVDTYALLAIVYDEVGEKAREVLDMIRRKEVVGLIPSTVAYEYIVHWLRGRIPGLKTLDEVLLYLKGYFEIIDVGFEDYIAAAKIKVIGDSLLRKAEDERLKRRRLSIVDSTIIAVAQKHGIPIITGDKDLSYVALNQGIEVIWE